MLFKRNNQPKTIKKRNFLVGSFLSIYSWRFPINACYMLQASEYDVSSYLKWLWRTTDFSVVQYRKKLDLTPRAKAVIELFYALAIAEIVLGLGVIIYSLINHLAGGWPYGLAIIIVYPIVISNFIVLPILFMQYYIINPKLSRDLAKAKVQFKNSSAIKIAVLGSYGKTTMKEMLANVIGGYKKVVYSPANKNVLSEHLKLAQKLTVDDEVIIVEFGEGQPGDIAKFADLIQPDYAVITGLAPAHLNKYKTLTNVVKDLLSIKKFVNQSAIFYNAESLTSKALNAKQGYSLAGIGEFKAHNIKNSLAGLSFELTNSKTKTQLTLKTKLLGRHQVGPVSLVACLALNLGLKPKQIEQAISQLKPFEHRMELREIKGGYLIDDSYNGNLEGIKAGTSLLGELMAKTKIYITPGLVDQGPDNLAIHKTVGQFIAKSQADQVFLVKNSVSSAIQSGLEAAGYQGQVTLIEDPVNFFSNLDSLLARDVVVMIQNDWPDNYF